MRNPGVVGFHGFSEKLTISGSTVIRSAFVKAVKELLQLGYTFRTLSEYNSTSFNDKSLFYYFDDCDLSTYNLFVEELNESDFVGTLFPISNYIDAVGEFDVINKERKLMNVEQLKELQQRGFEIGSHTATHIPLVIEKSKAFWHREVIESKLKIESLLNCNVKFLSVPFGNYSRELVDYVVSNGYSGVVSINDTLNDSSGMIIGHPAYNLDTSTSIVVKSTKSDDLFARINSFLYNQFSKGSVLLKSF